MEINKLEDMLYEDWTWRKTEVSELILLAETEEKNVLLKSIILLLYAHWEGYIKKSSRVYLKFICENKIKISELTENFKAVALKGLSKEVFKSTDTLSLSNEIKLIQKYSLINGLTIDKLIKIDLELEKDKSIIDTQDNLNPSVFKNILEIIGLNYNSQYEVRKTHLDNDLLAYRNSIGHGNKKLSKDSDFDLEINSIKKLRDILFSIIENFRDEIIYYSQKEYYLKENQHKILDYTLMKETQLESIFNQIDRRY